MTLAHSELKPLRRALLACVLLLAAIPALAGGPRYVAGASYFNPGVKGQPVRWATGQVTYLVDRGPLNASISNQQATAMVDAAAAPWNAIPTAAVNLADAGSLAEDVTGANVQAADGLFLAPADVASASTASSVAVVFDADGSVIEALDGPGSSAPSDCEQNGVLVWIDAINPDATLGHGAIVLNGRCATSAPLVAMMRYQLERAFGRILGLDFAQVNDIALAQPAAEPGGALAWPVMHPLSGDCGPSGGACIVGLGAPRMDDVAALNRLYPVTAANVAAFPGKILTAAHTVSIQGTLSFRGGLGMQGVNVVVRPLDSSGNPLYQYTVTFVSGSYFCGNHGNPVTGWTDTNGNRLDRFGSDDLSLQGWFDLSGIPLPPGVTMASYQVTFEPVNPLYIDLDSVGPYTIGSPAPSGTMPVVNLPNLPAGSQQTLALVVNDSAGGPVSVITTPTALPRSSSASTIEAPAPLSDASAHLVARARRAQPAAFHLRRPGQIGSESSPLPMPASGMWTGKLAQVGQTDWFTVPVRGNRIFTLVAQALDETGRPTSSKAMPALGVWDGFDTVGLAAVGSAPAQNGSAPGETWLHVATSGDDIVRMAIADQRGDGRPDYAYRGWILYADTVSPQRLPAAGGLITIRGMGFRSGDTVKAGGIAAPIVSLSPSEIVARVPAAAAGVTGSQDVEVDDLPQFYAMTVIPGGVSYDAAAGDALAIATAPSGQVPLNTPEPFAVLARDSNDNPIGGVTVVYSITSGAATLACGQPACQVTTTGDGRASLAVTATSTSSAIVTAALLNGNGVQAHFFGGSPAIMTALTPTLYLAAGTTVSWPVQALILNTYAANAPTAGQSVLWQSTTGIAAPATPSISATNGIASATLAVSGIAEGQIATSKACVNGGLQCASFNVFGTRAEFATLTPVSGAAQTMPFTGSPGAVTLRVLDMNGNPMAGGIVAIYQALYAWTPPCPPHGRCAQAQLLASQSLTLTSALDGTVTVTPLTLPGQATNLIGIAATGNAGSLTFTIEQHP